MSKISGSNITITAGVGVTIENSTIESRNIIGASEIQQTSQENDIQSKDQLGNQTLKYFSDVHFSLIFGFKILCPTNYIFL